MYSSLNSSSKHDDFIWFLGLKEKEDYLFIHSWKTSDDTLAYVGDDVHIFSINFHFLSNNINRHEFQKYGELDEAVVIKDKRSGFCSSEFFVQQIMLWKFHLLANIFFFSLWENMSRKFLSKVFTFFTKKVKRKEHVKIFKIWRKKHIIKEKLVRVYWSFVWNVDGITWTRKSNWWT